MMKRVILLSLAALSLTGSYIAAYDIELENGTDYPAVFSVTYATLLCKDDTLTVLSGQTIKKGIGGCSITGVSATVNEQLQGGMTQTVVGQTQQQTRTASPYNSTYTGSTKFIVTGTANNPVANNRYKVTRFVQ